MEHVWKGRFARGGMPEVVESLLSDHGVPEWYVESMKKIRYLFPKVNDIIQVKRELLTYQKTKK